MGGAADPNAPIAGQSGDAWLMLACERGGVRDPMHADWMPKEGDLVHLLVQMPAEADAVRALRERGWDPANA